MSLVCLRGVVLDQWLGMSPNGRVTSYGTRASLNPVKGLFHGNITTRRHVLSVTQLTASPYHASDFVVFGYTKADVPATSLKTHCFSTTKNQLMLFIKITAFLVFLRFLFLSRPFRSLSVYVTGFSQCRILLPITSAEMEAPDKDFSRCSLLSVQIALQSETARLLHAGNTESRCCHLYKAFVGFTHRHSASPSEYRFVSTGGTSVAQNTQQCATLYSDFTVHF